MKAIRAMAVLGLTLSAVHGARVGRAGETAAAGGKAAVNPYNGMQQREERFEFAQKPQVKKEGDKWIITFASQGNCDATVALVDKDGRIVRHLASGVLGKNAPWPFQQNSLSQKVEWDGTDDAGRPLPSEALRGGGCSVRVSLGLKPEFERNIGYDPFEMPIPGGTTKGGTSGYLVAPGKGDEVYVFGVGGNQMGSTQGRVFTKDGKYVRTFWPPPAKDVAKMDQYGYKTVKTVWGDSVLATYDELVVYASRFGRPKTVAEAGKVPFGLAGVADFKESPRPEWLPATTLPKFYSDLYDSRRTRMAADRLREELYVCNARSWGGGVASLRRIDGKTGEMDGTWFPNDGLPVNECCVGPDGSVYIGVGNIGYFQFIIRLDHDGKVVPFGGDGIPIARAKWEGGNGQYGCWEGKPTGGSPCPGALGKVDVKALWTGVGAHSNTHDRGLYVSPRGDIVAALEFPLAERAMKYGVPKECFFDDKRFEGGVMSLSFVAVWDGGGKLLTANAVGDMSNGHGVTMDRDGNIYAVLGGALSGEKTLVGLAEPVPSGAWGGWGSIMKFRGGVPFPRSKSYQAKGEAPPADAFKTGGMRVPAIKPEDGALLWAYPGVVCQSESGSCSCHMLRYDMDYFARHWIPANYLNSVMVVDANGNIVARVGRYGNVDDADEACGKIHFVWPRALCVSDGALYVADPVARRIVKAAIKYAAEESVPLP